MAYKPNARQCYSCGLRESFPPPIGLGRPIFNCRFPPRPHPWTKHRKLKITKTTHCRAVEGIILHILWGNHVGPEIEKRGVGHADMHYRVLQIFWLGRSASLDTPAEHFSPNVATAAYADAGGAAAASAPGLGRIGGAETTGPSMQIQNICQADDPHESSR